MQYSQFLLAIEGCWRAVQAKHPEIPDVVMILASGEERGQLVKFGHFAPLAWRESDGRGRLDEVLVSGEAIDRPAVDIVGTVIHEAVHALAQVRRIQDTSRQGRYHNKLFKQLAESMGLEVVQLDGYGWARTKMAPDTVRAYQGCIAAIDKLPRAVRRFNVRVPGEDDKGAEGEGEGEEGEGESGGKGASRSLLATCACTPARKIRVARKTIDAGPIVCGICDESFTVEA